MCFPHCLSLFLISLPLLFSPHPSLCKLKKKKKKNNQCHKSVHLNSAHMTFPSSLIASIQFISASHARPQSIKHALLQRSSCPIITPIIKVEKLWVRPSQMMTGETNRFLNSPKAGRKQIKAIGLESKNTGALAWRDLGISTQLASQIFDLWAAVKSPHNVTWRELVTFSLLPSQPIPKHSSGGPKGRSSKCPLKWITRSYSLLWADEG